MHLRSALLLPLSISALQADAVSDLKVALAKLNTRELLKANVEYQFWRKDSEDKQAHTAQGRAYAWVEDGPQGLKIVWNPQLLQQMMSEQRAQDEDPEKETPSKDAMSGLSTLNLVRSFTCAEELLRMLQQGQLQEERQDTFQGQPAKLLVFKLNPKVNARQKKHLKDMSATAKVWLAADGTPLGAWRQQSLKGSFMFIKFESTRTEDIRFAKVGNRLVATYLQEETTGSGAGNASQQKSITKITLN